MLIWIPVAAVLAVSAPAWADGREGAEPKKVSIPKPVKAVKAKKIKRAVSAPAPQKEAVQPVAETKKAEANAGKKKEAAGVPVPATAAIKTEEIKPAAVVKAAIKEPKKAEPPVPLDYVMIESKPTNAELLVDGLYVGNTPLQIPLKDGAHMVKLVYPGYEEWERKVSVYRGLRVAGLMTEKPKSVASAQQ